MRQPTFRQIIMKSAAPILKDWEYLYDDSLADRAITYGFRKHLENGIDTTIQFQRHQYNEVPYGYGFTVNMERHRVDASGRKRFVHTEGDFSTRLGSLIVNAYGLRLYPYWDHWWEAASPEQLKTELTDVMRRLERYGIPALEDLDYRDTFPSGMPGEWNSFQDTVDEIVSADLSELGYKSEDDPDPGPLPPLRPRRQFIKHQGRGLYNLIGFQPLKCLHKPTVNADGEQLRWFAVSIARKRSDDPNAELDPADNDTFMGWLDSSARHSIKAIISDSGIWEYEMSSLSSRLSTALEELNHYGIPMLEAD